MENIPKKYSEAELSRLHTEAEAMLKKIPGVLAVGFGIKEKKGGLIQEMAFRVYVREKKAKEELLPEEVIPIEINGFKTDVIKIQERKMQGCNDNDHHDPIVGGISITTFNLNASSQYALGTIGCFGTINGNTSKDNIALITNNHVLTPNGGKVGDEIYQPQFRTSSSGLTIDDKEKYPIGTILDMGALTNYPYLYPAEIREPSETVASNYYIDCASVKVATCHSTCCNTNCGVHYKNEILNLKYKDIEGNNSITGIARVRRIDIMDDSVSPPVPKDYFVYKSGRTTGRTKGRVIDVAQAFEVASVIYEKSICVKFVASDPGCSAQARFSDEGDSGSVIVNDKGEVIGLHSVGDPADISISNACHIHPVLDRLKINIITTSVPGGGGRIAESSVSTNTGLLQTKGRERLQTFQKKLRETAYGNQLYDAFEKCRQEIVWMVNHKRPVTLAWHRNQGPAFVAHFVNNANDDLQFIPHEVKGISLLTLLKNMSDVLKKTGSKRVRDTIYQHEDKILAAATSTKDIEIFLDLLTTPLTYER